MFRRFIAGIGIGIANIIPGVSGGTMAVMLGLYDQLIIAGTELIQLVNYRRNIWFLLPIVIGVGVGIKGFASVVVWMLDQFPVPTQLFWVGLILGSIPSLITLFKVRSFNNSHWFLLLLFFVMLVIFGQISPETSVVNVSKLWFFGVAGVLASASMILPGLSGSLIMMILGVYHPLMVAIEIMDLKILLVVGVGAVVGGIVAVFGMRWLLKRFEVSTHAAILGLVLGSVPVISPNIGMVIHQLWFSVLAVMVGFCISFVFFQK